ncbi:MAG: ABC transporter permease [Christensenellaceae bacterium]|jgi:ribose/xylose/arabinose/galactoside ABC-type transport system permease subunit
MSTGAKELSSRKKFNFRDIGILLILIGLIIVLAVMSESFRQPANLINIFKQAAINGILATGMMFVILIGGIDLSVGAIVAIVGIVAAHLAQKDTTTPVIVPVVLAILTGLGIGLGNGALVAYAGIPSFIVTLGTQTIVRGCAYLLSGGKPIFNLSKDYEAIAGTNVGIIPMLVIYYIAIVLVTGFVLTKTVYGRRVYALGGNETAAKVSGINTKALTLSVFGICGLMAGVAGMLSASRTVSGSPVVGEGYELDAIAAVVIGGFSMTGGSGKWWGTLIGALILAVIANGLDILRVSTYYQYLIKGAIIITAVLLDIRSKAKQ